MSSLDRKQKLLTNIDISKKGLELGPLCWPLLTKSEANIKYVDHVSTVELKKLYKNDEGVDLDKIVDVDYPLNGRPLSEAIGKKKFNYVIASHVIEHIADTVSWLQDIAQIIEDDGILTLAIPDKRYTFDLDRHDSKLSDVIAAYLEKYEKPSSQMVFDYASAFRLNVKAESIWQGELYLSKKAPHRYSLLQAYGMCLDNLEGKYIDTHCYVYTPQSFFGILKGLIDLELLDYKVAAFYDTVEGSYEFIVQLQKVKKDRKTQLASIPKLLIPQPYRQLERRVAEYNVLLQERDALRNEVSQLRNSLSWKVTKPLRGVRWLVRRLKR